MPIRMEAKKRGRPAKIKGAVIVSARFPPDIVGAIDKIVANGDQFYLDRSEFIREVVVRAVREREKRSL